MTNDLVRMCRPQETHDLTEAVSRSKEAMQELILRTLDETGFFGHAAFHGGTCLRILHGLDRFSEDLDFSLLSADPGFGFSAYADSIVDALSSQGVVASCSLRSPRGELQVYSAKVKCNLRQMLGACGFDEAVVRAAHSQENMVVKIDVDIDPADCSRSVLVAKTGPLKYTVRTEPLPVLFAGKVSAVLCRHWGNRVKGRDLYDFRWYVERGVPLDLECLAVRMDKKCSPDGHMDETVLLRMLDERFEVLDWRSASDDLMPFLEREEQLDPWGPEHFKALARRIEFV